VLAYVEWKKERGRVAMLGVLVALVFFGQAISDIVDVNAGKRANDKWQQQLSDMSNSLVRATNELAIATNKLALIEEKNRQREISPEQYLQFVAALDKAPKKPVWVVASDPSVETQTLASQVRRMLNDALYSVPPGSPTESRVLLVGASDDRAIFNPMNSLPAEYSKADAFVIVAFSPLDEGHEPAHGLALCGAFRTCKIPAQCTRIGNLVNTGEVAVIVTSKSP
jgi:hypothetical protein